MKFLKMFYLRKLINRDYFRPILKGLFFILVILPLNEVSVLIMADPISAALAVAAAYFSTANYIAGFVHRCSIQVNI